MTWDNIAAAVALIAAIIMNAGAYSQLHTAIRRRGDCPGVSVTATANIAASCAAWTLYAAATGLWVTAISSASGFVQWAIVAALVVHRRQLRELAWPAAFASALTLTYVIGGLGALGAILVIDTVVTTVPQLWRARSSSTGLSRRAWIAVAASASCWVFYGVTQGDLVLTASQGVRGLIAAAIVTTITINHTTRQPGAPGDTPAAATT